MRAPRFLHLVGPALIATLAAPAASAQEATTAGAAALVDTFETYLGRPEPGTPSVVTVTPKGESYALDVDLDALARPLRGLGVDLRAGHWRATLTPLADGTWRHRMDTIGAIAAALPSGQTVEARFEGVASDGIFDPKLGGFTTQSTTIAGVTTRSAKAAANGEPALETEEVQTGVRLEGTMRPAAGGLGIDADLGKTIARTTQTITVSGGGGGVPDMTFTVALDGMKGDVGFSGLRSLGLLGLWSHLVARHAPEDFAAGQGALKARIREALPLFERFRQTVIGSALSVETPFGYGGARTLAASIDSSGLVRDGRFDVALHFDGVEVRSILMPAWIGRLIPSEIALAVRGSGHDLATPASVFLDVADFAAAEPLPPAEKARIQALFLPRGTMELDFAGNRLRGTGWEVTLDGRLTAAPAGPVGALTIRATGLDAIERILSDPKTGPQGKEALDALHTATALADRKEQSLVWRIDIDKEAVAVNGRPMSSGGKAVPAPDGNGAKPKQQPL
jgi:hypothetical protein